MTANTGKQGHAGYAALRSYISAIDKALDQIEAAKKVPDHRAYEQRLVELKTYYDGYNKPTESGIAAAKAALKALEQDARERGESERDGIIAHNVAIIESMRANLCNAVGAAVIDLGVTARTALSQATGKME